MLLLLDRDGVLNANRPDYVKAISELVLLPGSAAAVARLNAAGHRVAVCTNQSAVGRGIIAEDRLAEIHGHLRAELARAGGRIDALYHAPDPPWAASERRKPGPGMLREAMQQLRRGREPVAFIGDSLSDLQAAHAAGCDRILVRSGHGAAVQAAGIPPALLPVRVFEDLARAVEALLAEAIS